MALRAFKQDYLYSRKGDFYVLSEQRKYSITKLAKVFGVSRSTVWEFKNSDPWKKWVFLLKGDPIAMEVLRHRGSNSYDKIALWNRTEREDVQKLITKKYGALIELLRPESSTTQPE